LNEITQLHFDYSQIECTDADDRHEQFLIDIFSKTIINSQINKWKPQERKYAQ